MFNNHEPWEVYLKNLDQRIQNYEASLLRAKNNLDAIKELQNKIRKHFQHLAELKSGKSL